MPDVIDYKKKLEQELKRKIPEFQQGSDDLDAFLELTGAYFDKVRAKIDELQYSYDAVHSTTRQLVLNSMSKGIEFPINLSEEVLRIVVRDIAEVYRRKGTKDTIRWLFRIMDLDVDIREAWLFNPRVYEVDYIQDVDALDDITYASGSVIGTLTFGDVMVAGGSSEAWEGPTQISAPLPEAEFYYINPPSMNLDTSDFIYGHVNVYDDGAYFDGVDVFGNDYSKVPILGEEYKWQLDPTSDDVIGKVPYIFINIDIDQYQEFGKNNGLKTPQEMEQTLLDSIRFLRPANLVIVFVLTLPDFIDSIDSSIGDDVSINYLYSTTFADLDEDKTYNHNTIGEYFQVVGNDYQYIRSREDYEHVPQNMFTEITTSIDSAKNVINLRDHAYVRIRTNLINGDVSYSYTSDDRIKVATDQAAYTSVQGYSRTTDYESDVSVLGDIEFGELGPGASEPDIDTSDWLEVFDDDYVFLNKSALSVEKGALFSGMAIVEVEFFSMLHRTIGSNKFQTRYDGEGYIIDQVPSQLLESVVLCDFNVTGDGTLMHFDGNNSSFEVSISNGNVSVNGSHVASYNYGTDGSLAIQLDGGELKVWFIDHNGNREEHSMAFPTNTSASLFIGQNSSYSNPVAGTIHDVYFSTDDLTQGHYSEFFNRVLQGYRNGEVY